MEKKCVKSTENSKLFEIKQNEIFKWKLEKEEVVNEHVTKLYFERDDSLSYIKELRTLEKSFYKVSWVPLWLLVVLSVITISFYSVFLVIYLINKGEIDMGVLFPSILVPGIVFMFALGILGMIRTKDTTKYIKTSVERFESYEEKVKELETK